MLWDSNEYSTKTKSYWWRIYKAFVSTFLVAFCTTHRQNKTHGFYTEGFVPVTSLCGVVGSPSWFTKCLIGRIGNIWSVMYINARCIYLSESHAFTIIDCVVVCNFRHITSTWPLIYWWSGASNAILTPCIERPSWNSLEANFVPVLYWTIYISHQPNLSTLPYLEWNISSFSITSLVMIFSTPCSFEVLE